MPSAARQPRRRRPLSDRRQRLGAQPIPPRASAACVDGGAQLPRWRSSSMSPLARGVPPSRAGAIADLKRYVRSGRCRGQAARRRSRGARTAACSACDSRALVGVLAPRGRSRRALRARGVRARTSAKVKSPVLAAAPVNRTTRPSATREAGIPVHLERSSTIPTTPDTDGPGPEPRASRTGRVRSGLVLECDRSPGTSHSRTRASRPARRSAEPVTPHGGSGARRVLEAARRLAQHLDQLRGPLTTARSPVVRRLSAAPAAGPPSCRS